MVDHTQTADLVLEGGGVKGIGLVGAITVLEERGYRVNRLAGASAGAIVGALVAAGYTSTEMKAIMATLDYRRFQDASLLDRVPLVGKTLSLALEKGIYEGRYLKEWLGARLAEKGVRTWADLKLIDPNSSLPAAQQYKLVVMVSDISQGCLRRLPWDYRHYRVEGGADAAPVVDAVRASMSIPFFYEPVAMTAADGKRSWLVDGGMLSNFPVDTFDRPTGEPPRWPTFGIKLSARPEAAQLVSHRVHGAISMAHAMLSTMMGFHDQMHLEDPGTIARTIFVDTTGVKATDFDIDDATQQRLFDNGRRAAEKFLDGGDGQPPWDWERYVEDHRTPGGAAQAAGAQAGPGDEPA